MDDKKFPWERRPDESSKHYERFLTYLHLGPGRGPLAAKKAWEESGREVLSRNTWENHQIRYGWTARATAWDDMHRQEDERVFQERRKSWRNKRFELYERGYELAHKVLERTLEELESDDTRTPPLKDINNLLKLLSAESRQEFGDVKKDPKTQVNIDARQLKVQKIEVRLSGDSVPQLEGPNEVVDSTYDILNAEESGTDAAAV